MVFLSRYFIKNALKKHKLSIVLSYNPVWSLLTNMSANATWKELSTCCSLGKRISHRHFRYVQDTGSWVYTSLDWEIHTIYFVTIVGGGETGVPM